MCVFLGKSFNRTLVDSRSQLVYRFEKLSLFHFDSCVYSRSACVCNFHPTPNAWRELEAKDSRERERCDLRTTAVLLLDLRFFKVIRVAGERDRGSDIER